MKNEWAKRTICELIDDPSFPYLDHLQQIYQTKENELRCVDSELLAQVLAAYAARDDEKLIRLLLCLELFPVKDSYVAYLRFHKDAISQNRATVSRIAHRVYALTEEQLLINIRSPKETNRQFGPAFKKWVERGNLHIPMTQSQTTFWNSTGDCILNGSDKALAEFAHEYLGYSLDKGLDLVVRVNGQYVIGEAKFITDSGGHQNEQFKDALKLIESPLTGWKTEKKPKKVAILDGIVYLKECPYYRKRIEETTETILSAILLEDYLRSL